jgi:hypothetical protein
VPERPSREVTQTLANASSFQTAACSLTIVDRVSDALDQAMRLASASPTTFSEGLTWCNPFPSSVVGRLPGSGRRGSRTEEGAAERALLEEELGMPDRETAWQQLAQLGIRPLMMSVVTRWR